MRPGAEGPPGRRESPHDGDRDQQGAQPRKGRAGAEVQGRNHLAGGILHPFLLWCVVFVALSYYVVWQLQTKFKLFLALSSTCPDQLERDKLMKRVGGSGGGESSAASGGGGSSAASGGCRKAAKKSAAKPAE